MQKKVLQRVKKKSELKETRPVSAAAVQEESEAMKEVDSGRKSVKAPASNRQNQSVAIVPAVVQDPEADQMADEAFRKALLEVN